MSLHKYHERILTELNLGTNADSAGGGLGAPIHTPAEYQAPKKFCAKCRGALEEQNEEPASYSIALNSKQIDLHNFGNDADVIDIGNVTVTFNIEIEARSWGIKGITVTPRTITPLSIEWLAHVGDGYVAKEGERLTKDGYVERTVEVPIDASNLKVEYSGDNSSVLTAMGLTIYFYGSEIDYHRSSITFSSLHLG